MREIPGYEGLYSVTTDGRVWSEPRVYVNGKVNPGKYLKPDVLATGRLHAWFKFLELRDGSKGHPQYEIVQLAQQVWPIIEEHWPIAAKAWKEKNG